MSFTEATAHLKAGQPVRRNKWAAGTYVYLVKSNRKQYLYKSSINRTNPNVRSDNPEVLYWRDIAANDWSAVPA